MYQVKKSRARKCRNLLKRSVVVKGRYEKSRTEYVHTAHIYVHMHVIVPAQVSGEDIRMHTSVRMEHSHVTLHGYSSFFFILVSYLLNAEVSVTTAAHMLAMPYGLWEKYY